MIKVTFESPDMDELRAQLVEFLRGIGIEPPAAAIAEAIVAPVDKPVNKPVEKPVEKLVEKPVDSPSDIMGKTPWEKPAKPPSKRERTEKQRENDERLRAAAKAKAAAKKAVSQPMVPPIPPPPATAESLGLAPDEVARNRARTIEDLQAAYANGYQKEVFELLSRFGNGAKSFRELPPEAFVPIREAIDNGALT